MVCFSNAFIMKNCIECLTHSGCLKTAKLFHIILGPKTDNVLPINLRVYINPTFYFLNNFNKIQYFNEPVCAENKYYVQAILCS